MRKGLLLLAVITFMFFAAVSYAAAQLQKPVKVLPSTPSATPAPKPVIPAPPKPAPVSPPPSPLPILNVTTPNGGEKWLIGSMQNITWTTNMNRINLFTTEKRI